MGCSAMAVNGTRIVTASYGEEHGLVCFRDFFNATCAVSKREDVLASKFWDPQSYSDGDAYS
jgi:F-box/WD-40 domain protein 7